MNADNNPDLIVIPYQRDIRGPSENVVTVLLGDGRNGLGDCPGPNSVAAGDLGGNGFHTIVVA